MMERPAGGRHLWRRLTCWYGELLSWLLAISLGVLVIPVALQIFSRFTALIPHYIWTEEMARFLFVWTIMVGAMIGVRESTHFEVDLWPRLSARADAAVKLIARLGVLVIARVPVGRDPVHRPSLIACPSWAELPLWTIHIAWPIAGATWLIFLGEQMYDELRVLLGKAP